MTTNDHDFDLEVRIVFGTGEDRFVRIKGCIIKPSLHLFSMPTFQPMTQWTKEEFLKNAKTLSCINFDSTYFGTDKIQCALLFNNSPEKVDFVTILEEGVPGEELSMVGGQYLPLDSLVAMMPDQGTLAPFEIRPVILRLCPRWYPLKTGFQFRQDKPIEQHQSFFLQIMNSSVNTETEDNDCKSQVELAIKTHLLPVQLMLETRDVMDSISVFYEGSRLVIDFHDMFVGESKELTLCIVNKSQYLPVSYHLPRVAQFQTLPSSGNIAKDSSVDILVRFKPKQQGNFDLLQRIQIYGQITHPCNPQIQTSVIIYEDTIALRGNSHCTVEKPIKANFIERLSSEPFQQILSSNLLQKLLGNSCHVTEEWRQSVLEKLKKFGLTKLMEEVVIVAASGDFSASIRPSDASKEYRTALCRLKRHNYCDPDYQLTNEETVWQAQHRKRYLDAIKLYGDQRRILRADNEDKAWRNPPEIGMKPLELSQSELELTDIGIKSPKNVLPNSNCRPLNKKKLDEQFQLACQNKAPKDDKFTPKIQPECITVTLQVDCAELRQTTPLQYVVAPESQIEIDLVFASKLIGKFQRNLKFKINDCQENHVILLAEVVPISLDIEPAVETVILNPQGVIYGEWGEKGLRSTVTLTNPLNAPATFQWEPIFNFRGGTDFSMRPKQGTIAAFSKLSCELIFYPSFGAYNKGEFRLLIEGDGGFTEKTLRCQAIVPKTRISLSTTRLALGPCAHRLWCSRVVTLTNTGQGPAFFRITRDNLSVLDLDVRPSNGEISPKCSKQIKIFFLPKGGIGKFEESVRILINSMDERPLVLKIGGNIVAPCVDLLQNSFKFEGTHVGSMKKLPLELVNRSSARAVLEFDLTEERDFAVEFAQSVSEQRLIDQCLNCPEDLAESVYSTNQSELISSETCTLRRIFRTFLRVGEKKSGFIVFRPSEVATHDFFLNVCVNGIALPISGPSPAPDTPNTTFRPLSLTPFRGNSSRTKSSQSSSCATVNGDVIVTARRHIQATALRPIVSISPSDRRLALTQNGQSSVLKIDSIAENDSEPLRWNMKLDSLSLSIVITDTNCMQRVELQSGSVSLEPSVFEFSNSTEIAFVLQTHQSLKADLHLPLYLEQMSFNPVEDGKRIRKWVHFDTVQLSINVCLSNLVCQPARVSLCPVPLGTQIRVPLTLTSHGAMLDGPHTISVCWPTCPMVVKSNYKIKIPQNMISPQTSPFTVEFPEGQIINPGQSLDVVVVFESDEPIDLAMTPRPPCLLFVASSHENRAPKVACVPISGAADNCLLSWHPFVVQRPNQFVLLCDQKESNQPNIQRNFKWPKEEDSVLESILTTPSITERGQSAIESAFTTERFLSHNFDADWLISDDQLKLVLERWLNAYGFAEPRSVKIPDSFSTCLSWNRMVDGADKEHETGPTSSNVYSRSLGNLFACLSHLCGGKNPPGIPSSVCLPLRDGQEALAIIYTHLSVLITFVRSQGGCLPHLCPEFLMDWDDYLAWLQFGRPGEAESMGTLKVPLRALVENVEDSLIDLNLEVSPVLDKETFACVSQRAWTDLLLQSVKSLVLQRLTNEIDSTVSNCYSQPEKDLSDGIVLGVVLGAHVPILVNRFLRGKMFIRPETSTQCLHNAILLVDALRMVGFEYDIRPVSICSPHPVEMLLLCYHLYRAIPEYQPKGRIDFCGKMHQKVMKEIQLTNTSSRPLLYHCFIVGGNQFKIIRENDPTQLPIGAKSTATICVQFQPKFIHQTESLLFAVGKRVASSPGTTLVYKLTGNVSQVEPTARFNCPPATCYEPLEFPLAIHKPFPEHGEFSVSLLEASSVQCLSGMLLKQKPLETTAGLRWFYTSQKTVTFDGPDKTLSLCLIPFNQQGSWTIRCPSTCQFITSKRHLATEDRSGPE
ncbi:Cilia- and flagella-associated protein 47 [Cichlidogyrus casuarinus]|uniref:Cilia- and flagella-associated protein 47 n=1 Tax=Cichlidogyrus casuarinus TaxID=1844966 RepID=A0ABD2QME7_9PLAT